MENDETVEVTTPNTSLKDQVARLVLATAVSFIAGKVAETAYDTVVTKIRDAKTKTED